MPEGKTCWKYVYFKYLCGSSRLPNNILIRQKKKVALKRSPCILKLSQKAPVAKLCQKWPSVWRGNDPSLWPGVLQQLRTLSSCWHNLLGQAHWPYNSKLPISWRFGELKLKKRMNLFYKSVLLEADMKIRMHPLCLSVLGADAGLVCGV